MKINQFIPSNKVQAVLFDLDGTLVDTAKDLGAALNHLLTQAGKTPLSAQEIRPYVSGGTPALIKLGFGLTPEDQQFEQLKQSFLNYYEKNLCLHSTFFKGIESSLTQLESHEISWGIVTNKPGYLTAPLLKILKLDLKSKVTISGDTYEQRKPHPMPLLKAAEKLSIASENCIYVGDDERDIVAAKAAGMYSMSVGWGYPCGKNPLDWNADIHLEKSEALKVFFDEIFSPKKSGIHSA